MCPNEHPAPVCKAATLVASSSSEYTQAVGGLEQSAISSARATLPYSASQTSFAASSSIAVPNASPTQTIGAVAERTIMGMGMAKRRDGTWTCTVSGCLGMERTFRKPREHAKQFHPSGTLIDSTTSQTSLATNPTHAATRNSIASPNAPSTTLGPRAERTAIGMGMAKRRDGAWICTVPGCLGKGYTFKRPYGHGKEFHPSGTLIDASLDAPTTGGMSMKRPADFGAGDEGALRKASKRRRVSNVPRECDSTGKRAVPSFMVERATRTGPRWFCTVKGCNAAHWNHKGWKKPWSHVYTYHEGRDRLEEVRKANTALAGHYQMSADVKACKERELMRRVDQGGYYAPRDGPRGSTSVFNGSENHPHDPAASGQREFGHQEDDDIPDVEEHHQFDAEMDDDDTDDDGYSSALGTGDAYDDEDVEIVPEEDVVLIMRRRVRGSADMAQPKEKEASPAISTPSSPTKRGRDWQSPVSRWMTKM